MELRDIQKKTKLPLRKLRYVLDHRILPGTRVKLDSSRVGHPREFTDFEGFGIALAAALLDAGLQRRVVGRFFDAMTEIPWQPARAAQKRVMGPLESVFFQSRRTPCVAQIADGRYLAFQIGRRNMRWVDLQSPRFNRVQYEPWTILSANLARMRDTIRQS